MTNHLVGDVYEKIIEEVAEASRSDFEESGVGSTTLEDLKKEWQSKLSQRNVAQMPWDPKPTLPVQPSSAAPAANGTPNGSNGVTPADYGGYDNKTPLANGQPHIKTEPGTEQQYNGLPPMNTYPQQTGQQGGAARAAQLMQQNYGSQAAASLNALQQQRGGLALPGQPARPQGLQLPAQNPQQIQQQYTQQQRQNMMRQQQQLQAQQQQPGIKVEGGSPNVSQGGFSQQANYGQTDGADEGMDEWRTMLVERRALHAKHGQQADRMMRDQVAQLSRDLESGLMIPLDKQSSRKSTGRSLTAKKPRSISGESTPKVPQLDGDEDDEKLDIKDEDDEDAINSDLDDSDDDQGPGGDEDDEDEAADKILCTYDKVQRVKNKWKCTLKDGVLNTGGKEYLFHKAQGEFEW